MLRISLRLPNILVALAIASTALGLSDAAMAQGYRLRGISPIFDGWEEGPDKSRLFYFGYINRNSTESTIAIGSENGFDGGQPDRGQPTTFLTGRQEHVFTVRVPADFKGKLVWTIKSEMGAQTATASFNQLYMLEQRENASADARPPEVKVSEMAAKVGERVALQPAIKPAVSGGQVVVEAAATEAAGLTITWSKYRGPGAVSFSSTEPAAGAGRGAAARGRGAAAPGVFPITCGGRPAAGCGAVAATFSAPGEYTLRIAARQDGMQGLGFLRVTINP